MNSFNEILFKALQPLVYEIDKKDVELLQQKMGAPVSTLQKILLALPAAIGWLLHTPLYFTAKTIASKKAFHNDHFDSIVFGIVFLIYPFYLLATAIVASSIVGSGYWLLVFFVPFTAWSCMMLKKQF